MATVNIANNGWTISRQTDTIDIVANSSSVKFDMGWDLTDEMACAKACVAIDTSKYSTITLQYSSVKKNGNSSLYFGVFDSMTAYYYWKSEYDNDISPESLSGIGVTKITPTTSSQVITIDIPSQVGTKYVGFLFYGNTYYFDDEVGWGVQQEITITSLTAVEIGYTLTYNANGGSGAPGSVSDIRSTTISNQIPTRSSYDFLGWSTSSTATYPSYVAGNPISLTSDITLYAVWQKFYTITYNANGGSNAPSLDKKIDGQTLALSDTFPTPPTKTSVTYTVTFNTNGGVCDQDAITITNITTYEFINWNTKSDGSGMTYQIYDLYTDNSDITLYAQYEPTTFNNLVFLPTPTRSGYKFLGWATNEDDISGITGEYTPTSDIVLYAIWKRMGNVYIYDGTGGFNTYQVLIYDGSGWNQYIPYIYTESGWEIYSG